MEPLSSREESEEEAAAGRLVSAAGLTWLARIIPDSHRLNMEFIWTSYAHLYSLTETPQLPPSPHLGSYTRALLVRPR